MLGVQAEQSLTEEELSLFIPALKGELCCRLAELCPVLEKTPEKPELAEELEQLRQRLSQYLHGKLCL